MCGQEYYVTFMAALLTEAVSYGVYAALFAGSVYVLLFDQRNKYFLAASICMFAACTALIALDFAEAFTQRITVSSTFCQDGTCYTCPGVHESVAETLRKLLLDTIIQAIFSTNQLVADIVLIYRCAGIWEWKRWVLTLPVLFSLASCGMLPYFASVVATKLIFSHAKACGYSQVPSQVKLYRIRRDAPLGSGPPPQWFAASELRDRLAVAALLLSFVTSMLTTSLIASRIWFLARESNKILGKRVASIHRHAIALVVESGALYSVVLLAVVITWYTSPTNIEIPQNAMHQMLGIAPTLIIVRVGLGHSFENQYPMSLDGIGEVLTPASRDINFVEPEVEPRPDLEARWTRDKPFNAEAFDVPLTVYSIGVSDAAPDSPSVEVEPSSRTDFGRTIERSSRSIGSEANA
ncbi:hypothetical protein EVG20_g5793 [Dentipellis fragilis]|uniref:G-protein coupled receptors family 1 profile domain-containing protein n=1 Tax=Dentipellis fragilis TaxID=205917 RepID=A0A4Y9YQN4_9AGAM|nr:hypothetical protein EVG20_g5793 [Dentipellis fragilis]